jgi:hypothetical protein
MENLSWKRPILGFILWSWTVIAQLPAMKSKWPVYNFTQFVHHDSNSTETFQQQYQLVTDFYKPGGPILFSQGYPQASMLTAEALRFTSYAAKLGAAVATLEHRYTGLSFPVGFDGGSNASYAEALTLNNILNDNVSFIKWAKKNLTGAVDSKVIAHGGKSNLPSV